MVNAVQKILASKGIKIARHLTGSYVTSLDMAGCSITLTVADSKLLSLWDSPVHTAALRWGS
jgi:dihydroxyacetone kinase-like protein